MKHILFLLVNRKIIPQDPKQNSNICLKICKQWVLCLCPAQTENKQLTHSPPVMRVQTTGRSADQTRRFISFFVCCSVVQETICTQTTVNWTSYISLTLDTDYKINYFFVICRSHLPILIWPLEFIGDYLNLENANRTSFFTL